MDTNEPQVEQSGCGCDSSSGDDTCCTPGGKKNWRTALFIGVVVLAGAVAAHSVLTNGDKGALSCGSAGGFCAIEQGNGNGDGQAGSKIAGCPMEQSNGNGDAAAGSTKAACPFEQGNGDGDAEACPKAGAPGKAAGCCPSMAPADPAPQPAPTGCCPGRAPADPAPQPAPTGCCPLSGS